MAIIEKRNIEELTADEFIRNYFHKNKPLILSGIKNNYKDEIIKHIQNNKSEYSKNKLWLQTRSDNEVILKQTPDLVSEVLSDDLSYKRKDNSRVWQNEHGDKTLLHADANGLFVFNLQLSGKKKWTIYNPNTNFKLFPFTNIPYLKYNTKVSKKIQSNEFSFMLNEGEMIFLPPYWFHKVSVVSEETININWVGTKKNNEHSIMYHRENLLIKSLLPLMKFKPIKNFIDLTMGSSEKDYLENYGGNGGTTFLKSRVKEVSLYSSIITLIHEIIRLPILLINLRRIKSYSVSKINK